MVTIKDVKKLRLRQTIYHKTLKNADGTALRARVNGKLKLWKTRPDEFRLPMKHGLHDYFYLTETNAKEWRLTEPPRVKKGRSTEIPLSRYY